LSIVAAIAEAHRGSLDLHASPGGGLKVTITLPLAPRAAATAVGAVSGGTVSGGTVSGGRAGVPG
jgi:hypothetical protein